MAQPYFNRSAYQVSTAECRAVMSGVRPAKLTRPMPRPAVDVFEELWVPSHISPSPAARAIVGAALVAYGMMQGNFLPLIAGLLFMPSIIQALVASFGLRCGVSRLLGQAASAFGIITALSVLAGVVVALLIGGMPSLVPILPLVDGAIVSFVIGVAAAIVSADDAGRVQLLGLAAASQLALAPVLADILLVSGLAIAPLIAMLVETFVVNVVLVLAGSIVAYVFLERVSPTLRRFETATEEEPAEEPPSRAA